MIKTCFTLKSRIRSGESCSVVRFHCFKTYHWATLPINSLINCFHFYMKSNFRTTFWRPPGIDRGSKFDQRSIPAARRIQLISVSHFGTMRELIGDPNPTTDQFRLLAELNGCQPFGTRSNPTQIVNLPSGLFFSDSMNSALHTPPTVQADTATVSRLVLHVLRICIPLGNSSVQFPHQLFSFLHEIQFQNSVLAPSWN